MNTIVECNLCGGKEFKFLFKNYDRMHGIAGEFSLWRCSCGLVFINPQPNKNEIAPYYPDEYGAYVVKKDDSMEGGFIEKLQNIYFSLAKEKVFQKIFFLPFRQFVRGVLIKPGARLLDVGCGGGGFIEKMRTCGMEVFGLDLSKVAVSKAREKGLSVFCGTLEEADFPKNSFDLITLNHVFEHLPDPMKALKELHRILKEDGVIIMGVPNISSLGFKMFGRYWMPLETPRHLFLFSLKVLKRYAEQTGFRIQEKHFQNPLGYSLISVDYLLNKFRNNKVLGINSFLSKSFLLKLFFFPWITLLSLTPWADSVEVWLKKVEKSGI